MENIYLVILYVVMIGPSILLVKETKSRVANLKDGLRVLVFLPVTTLGVVAYTVLAMDSISRIPFLNWSWLGYNIALGPLGDKGMWGIIPFLPFMIYTLVHVNYFEEMYFRNNNLRVIIWAFLHILMGVAIHVVLALLPLGFFYRYVFKKQGVNYSYALHFFTNISLLTLSLLSFFLWQ